VTVAILNEREKWSIENQFPFFSCLSQAILSSNVEFLKREETRRTMENMKRKKEDIFNVYFLSNLPLLYYATMRSLPAEGLQVLIDNGCDPYQVLIKEFNVNLLTYSCKYMSSIETTKLFLQYTPDVNYTDERGFNPLYFCLNILVSATKKEIIKQQFEKIKLLIDNGMEVFSLINTMQHKFEKTEPNIKIKKNGQPYIHKSFISKGAVLTPYALAVEISNGLLKYLPERRIEAKPILFQETED